MSVQVYRNSQTSGAFERFDRSTSGSELHPKKLKCLFGNSSFFLVRVFLLFCEMQVSSRLTVRHYNRGSRFLFYFIIYFTVFLICSWNRSFLMGSSSFPRSSILLSLNFLHCLLVNFFVLSCVVSNILFSV